MKEEIAKYLSKNDLPFSVDEYVKMRKYDNPFNDNHVFKKEDMIRLKLTWKDKMRIFFKRTFVQIGDGYVYKYKIGNDGTYYLLNTLSIKD